MSRRYYTVSLKKCQTSFFGEKSIDKKTIVQDSQMCFLDSLKTKYV